MSLINVYKKKTKKELRKYGLIMFSAFFVITIVLFLRDRSIWVYTFIPSVFFFLSSLLFPFILAPIERVWMKIGGVMGFVMTNILLTLVYTLGIIPIGILVQLFKGGSFEKGFQKKASTYWLDVPADGPASRPDKPF